jgi:hypothetical protein
MGAPPLFCRVLENKGDVRVRYIPSDSGAPPPCLPYRFVGKFLLEHGLGLDLSDYKVLSLTKCGVFRWTAPRSSSSLIAMAGTLHPATQLGRALRSFETNYVEDCRLGALRQGNSSAGTGLEQKFVCRCYSQAQNRDLLLKGAPYEEFPQSGCSDSGNLRRRNIDLPTGLADI